MKSTVYTAFGLTIRSSEKISNLPSTVSVARAPRADIEVEFVSEWKAHRTTPGEILIHETPRSNNFSSPSLSVWRHAHRGDYRLRFDSSVEFRVRQTGRSITVAKKKTVSMDEVSIYLLGPVMGLVLRLQGLVCLHASAVVNDGAAVALMAPPGYGKSTLAAAFAKMAYPVLADDLLVLKEKGNRLHVQPAYPFLRLRPEAVESLFGSRFALRGISSENPNLNKRILHLTGPALRFSDTAVELGAIYTGVESDRFDSAAVRCLSGVERFLFLCGNTYLARVMDREMHRAHFENLLRIYDRIPVRCIETPDRSTTTPFELGRLIMNDFNNRNDGIH